MSVNVYGRNLGKGVFGQEDAKSSFTIGDAVIATADDNTMQVTFQVNGETVMTMPTSMGKDSTPTDNGVYIIGDRFANMIMDSSTYGVPVTSAQGYKTPVDWATRMSYSGIFFHSAPWSVGQQGYSNTSHGCLNLRPVQRQVGLRTTPSVGTSSSSRTPSAALSPAPTALGDWNIPWSVWKDRQRGRLSAFLKR